MLKWCLFIPLIFFADTTKIEKQTDFDKAVIIIVRQAQDKKRQQKLDNITMKLDSILKALPDTVK